MSMALLYGRSSQAMNALNAMTLTAKVMNKAPMGGRW